MTTHHWSDEVSTEAILRDLVHRDPIGYYAQQGAVDRRVCRLCFAESDVPGNFVHHPTCVWMRAHLLANRVGMLTKPDGD